MCCALRQPIILMCITFMGNILVARAWRIGCIISPVAKFASSNDKVNRIGVARLRVMNLLSRFSQWGRFVGSCGRAMKRGNNTGMRRTITFADSIRVAMILLVPQLALQIINLSVPNVRMESIELSDGYACESSTGPSSVLIVGIVLSAIPYCISLLINTKSVGIPDKFLELDDILASMVASFWVLVITLPSAAMIGHLLPAAHAYLLSASVLSFLLPLSYNIAQKKANVIKSPGAAAKSSLLRQSLTPRESSAQDGNKKDNLRYLSAAEQAGIMGKMFETMGSKLMAVEINKDILTLFKAEDDFSWEVGSTMSEVHSLGPKSLEVVVKTLIGSAKIWWSTFLSNPDTGDEAKMRTIKSCMDALDIFDRAPAKNQLRDHSIVFSGFSFMNMIAKMITFKPPNDMPREEFERSLAQNFVKVTNHQQYHHCRALAMQADTMKRQDRHEDALLVIKDMKTIYDPKLHSSAIMKEYMTDHCGDIIAASITLLSHLDHKEEALSVCDYVIESILPEVEATELVSKITLLWPICLAWKDQDQATAAKALELYSMHVCNPAARGKAHPAVAGFVPPTLIILKCCSSGGKTYPNLKDDVAFMLNGESKCPAWLERSIISYLYAAFSTMYAESCLSLASLIGGNSQDKSALIKEGLRFLEVSEKTVKNEDGTIISTIAYSYYSRILSELESLRA